MSINYDILPLETRVWFINVAKFTDIIVFIANE